MKRATGVRKKQLCCTTDSTERLCKQFVYVLKQDPPPTYVLLFML